MASKSDPNRPTSRRDLIVGLGALGAVAGGWQLWANRPRPLAFEPIARLPGWRQIAFDGVTAGGGLSGAALAGLDAETEPLERLDATDLCAALFRDVPTGKVPVAVFSDFYCPFCRVLIDRLSDQRDPRITITWHELPLLGPSSLTAAKAALAAERQGGYAAFQSRIMGSQFRPSARFLTDAANAVGLDGARLVAEMESPEIEAALARTRAASRTLGIWGTPATVIGRTLVMGAVSENAMDRLIALEAEAGPLPC